MNAWDRAMRRAITEACRAADDDATVRALVFTGAGERAFGAGQDLREGSVRDPDAVDEWVDEWARFFQALRGCAKPTVAALNGVAAGSAMQFALMADARVGHAGTRMGQPEIKSGVASSMGPWILHAVLGPVRASELVLGGRLMGSAECERLGLLNRMVEPGEVVPEAVRLAAELGAHPPLAIRLTKERLRSLTEPGFRDAIATWKLFLRRTLAGA